VKVSALIITYNQERYIAAAIESTLQQKTDFPYEIVVSEDCSTDGTREVVRSYEAVHPDRIRVLYSPTNLGGVENFVTAWHDCRGQYIALLEGDDYWTSDSKLRKQVAFLDAHAECSMCAHGVTEVYQDSAKLPVSWIDPSRTAVSDLEDLLLENFVYSCSAMLRREVFSDFAPWVYTFSLSDVPLWVQAASHGKIGFIPEFLAVYRVHDGGVWSGKDPIYQVEQTIELYERLDAELDRRYTPVLARVTRRFRAQLACEIARVPSQAQVVVVGDGDPELLKLYRPARHLQSQPGESELEALRREAASGADFLLVMLDDLSSGSDLLAEVGAHHPEVWRDENTVVFELGSAAVERGSSS
jgi:glycosyltransferase involved in cell wall biosynthesis